MEKKWAADLFDKYPKLFAQVGLPPSETCMCWGICCGEGWRGIIEKACEDLQALADKTGAKIEFAQIKEKFGGLRLYIDVDDKIESRIDAVHPSGVFSISVESKETVWRLAHDITGKAEEESYRTCEVCGAPGEVREGNWIQTLCGEHYKPKGKQDE